MLYENNSQQLYKDLGLRGYSEEKYEELIDLLEKCEEKFTKKITKYITDSSGVLTHYYDSNILEFIGILECNPYFHEDENYDDLKSYKDIEELSHKEQLIVKEAIEKQAKSIGLDLDINEKKIKRYRYTF